MNNVTLSAERREGAGKGVARKLRQAGKVPAVLYGRDMEAVHIAIDAHDADLLFRSIPVDNTIIELKVEGTKEPHQTLVREIQTHPFKGSLIHVDFLRIQAGVKVELNVPVHLVGTPVGVKDEGGVLEQTVYDLPVACIPSAIPESFEVDVSHLAVNDVLHVSDLDIGEGVEVLIPEERTICSVSVPRAAIEADAEGEELEDELELEGPEAAADGEASDGGSEEGGD
jgi:large subunit ribosomal protein L25